MIEDVVLRGATYCQCSKWAFEYRGKDDHDVTIVFIGNVEFDIDLQTCRQNHDAYIYI